VSLCREIYEIDLSICALGIRVETQ